MYILRTRDDRTSPDKPITALAYAGVSQEDVKEDAYYSYVWARILGWPWADWFTLRDKPGEELYDVRLGGFVTEPVQLPNAVYRICRDGVLVAVTAAERQVVEVPIPEECRFERMRDVFRGQDRRVREGVLRVRLPGQSGRVFAAVGD